MKNTTPTIYGDLIQACSFGNAVFEVLPHSTLNERIGFLQNVAPPPGVIPSLGWFCIGNQGHRQVVNGVDSWNTGRQHKPSEGGPFNILPFVLRPVNQDLTMAERQKYAGRKMVTGLDGKQYIGYYLKKLDLSSYRPAPVIIETVGGVQQFRPFVPTTADLAPTPTDLAPEEAASSNGQQLGIRGVITVVLSAIEIEEIVNACRILFDNADKAVLSEITLVSGLEYVTNGAASGGGVVEYTDVICAQAVSHLITHYQLTMVNNQVREEMVLGTSNPLMGAPR